MEHLKILLAWVVCHIKAR